MEQFRVHPAKLKEIKQNWPEKKIHKEGQETQLEPEFGLIYVCNEDPQEGKGIDNVGFSEN